MPRDTDQLLSDEAPAKTRQVALLVEDEPGLRTLVARLLTQLDYRVLQAEDGAEALDIARAAPHPIDVVVADVWMPVMGGDTFAEEFRRMSPETAIVFVSGQPPEGKVESILESGDAVFLSKPFSAEALEVVIQTAQERTRSRP